MHTCTHAHTDTWTDPSGQCTQAPEHTQVNTHHPRYLPHHWEHARGRGEGRRSAASSWWARSWTAGEQTLFRQPSHWLTAWTPTGDKTRQQVSKHSLVNLHTGWQPERRLETRQDSRWANTLSSTFTLADSLNADWRQDKTTGEQTLSRQPSHWLTAWTPTGDKTRQDNRWANTLSSTFALTDRLTGDKTRQDSRWANTLSSTFKLADRPTGDNTRHDCRWANTLSSIWMITWMLTGRETRKSVFPEAINDTNSQRMPLKTEKQKIKLVNKGINTTNYASIWTQSSKVEIKISLSAAHATNFVLKT